MNIRNSNEQVAPVFKKYYGIGNFKVVGINSNLSTLEALGFNYKNEPVYKVELNGETYQKLVFYVKNESLGITSKLEFLLSNKEVTFASGKQKFVNDLAQSSIGASLDECLSRTNSSGVAFFKNVNARAAKTGEAELLEFLVAWFNIKNFVSEKEKAAGVNPDTVVIDFNALVQGNVSELVGYLNMAKDNEVKLLMHIVNGYSTIYNKYFDRATANLNNFKKHITTQEAQGYPPKGDYIIGNLIEFDESSIKPSADIPEIPKSPF